MLQVEPLGPQAVLRELEEPVLKAESMRLVLLEPQSGQDGFVFSLNTISVSKVLPHFLHSNSNMGIMFLRQLLLGVFAIGDHDPLKR